MSPLERSNAELRAIVRLAGTGIVRLNFGKRDAPLLRKMGEVLRDPRNVRGVSYRVPIKLDEKS
jgi:hypothetical protein